MATRETGETMEAKIEAVVASVVDLKRRHGTSIHEAIAFFAWKNRIASPTNCAVIEKRVRAAVRENSRDGTRLQTEEAMKNQDGEIIHYEIQGARPAQAARPDVSGNFIVQLFVTLDNIREWNEWSGGVCWIEALALCAEARRHGDQARIVTSDGSVIPEDAPTLKEVK